MGISDYILVSRSEIRRIFLFFNKTGFIKVLKAIWYSFLYHRKSVLLSITFLISFLFLILYVSVKSGIEPSDVTRDYNGVYNFEIYVGFISNLGIFMWCTTLALTWFAWYLLSELKGLEKVSIFYWWSGFITLVLAVDDLFQFHEVILPRYFGLPEYSIYIVYLISLLIYSIKYHVKLFNQNVIFVFLAYVCFGLSMLLDYLEIKVPFETYVEDSLKFAGVCIWTLYFVKSIYLEFSNLVVANSK